MSAPGRSLRLSSVRHLLPALLLGAASAIAAGTTQAAAAPDPALGLRLDQLMREGEERPQASLAELHRLASQATDPAPRRAIAWATGTVAARSGLDAERLTQLTTLQTQADDPAAAAYAHLVQAEAEDLAGHEEPQYQQARAALRSLEPLCGDPVRAGSDCDWRAWWRALLLAYNGAVSQGNLVVAGGYLQTMREAASRAEDIGRLAWVTALQAVLAERNADSATANRLLGEARQLAQQDGAAWVRIRVATSESLVFRLRHQTGPQTTVLLQGLQVARQAGMARAEAGLHLNLSDVMLRQQKPADALAHINLALPVARSHRDRRNERALLHNGTLAKLALGQVDAARIDMHNSLELWRRDAGPGRQAEALREFSEALAKAGDTVGALALFHEEEGLNRQIQASNEAAAEQTLRARYDQGAQKRRLELLARDSALKSAQLDNQTLSRRLWGIGVAVLLVLAVFAVMALRRMRELNRQLIEREALLKAHSERDALTGLANRRQFREVMRLQDAEARFSGALLMVDVDHFKRINDRFGHGGGDRVLVEVARRLAAAVRGDDLVARWGGEEFLIFAPGVLGTELDQLAERVRLAIHEQPIVLEDGRTLTVSVSIGYAAFPLPSHHLPLGWEQAVNLADLSLYTAKNHGRNCAVGIVRTTAHTADALVEVEADLSRAAEDGRVTLHMSPAAPAAAAKPDANPAASNEVA